MAHRFTIDGNDQLESSLLDFQEEVRREVCRIIPESEIESILLGGGDGRGDGGVLQAGNEEWPYNDFEYYVFVHGNVPVAQKRYHNLLAAMGDRMGRRWNMHVDFKIASIPRWAGQTVSMFSYDLLERHYCVTGKDTPFPGCDHHHRADQIPLSEATRLMFNRCTGLLYSHQKLSGKDLSEEDIDFVTRNQAKMCLALGDSLLCANGQYHWSCRERNERLNALGSLSGLDDLNEIKEWHREGVAFKLHPEKRIYTTEQLRNRQEQLSETAGRVWLWIENKRLNLSCSTLKEYASQNLNKFPEGSRLKNLLLNLRFFGLGSPWSMRYPRENLYHALVWLLWENGKTDSVKKASSVLRLETTDPTAVIQRYEKLWERFG
jgi:hypothetical protein